jgi:tellurite resistance protein
MTKWQGFCSSISLKLSIICRQLFRYRTALAGLGSAGRGAERAWQLPKFIAGLIYVVAGVVGTALVVLEVLKALLAPSKLAAESAHPVQCCFIGLAGVATC